MEKTSLHYFCSLIIEDIKQRIEHAATTDKEVETGKHLIELIKAKQDFNGFDAPEDEQSIVFDSRTLYQAARPLVAAFVLLFLPFLMFGQSRKNRPIEDLDGNGKQYAVYSTRKANEDTLAIKFTLDCTQGVIWSGYRIRRRISSTATGFIYLGPDKKRIRKGCNISAIIP